MFLSYSNLEIGFFFVVCFWGNYNNIRDFGLDFWCEKKVSGKCSRYCINFVLGIDLKDGWNCCKVCIDFC